MLRLRDISLPLHTGTARFVHCTMYRLHCTVNVLGKAMRMRQMRNDADNAQIFANIFGYMRVLAKYGAWSSLQCTLCNSNFQINCRYCRLLHFYIHETKVHEIERRNNQLYEFLGAIPQS